MNKNAKLVLSIVSLTVLLCSCRGQGGTSSGSVDPSSSQPSTTGGSSSTSSQSSSGTAIPTSSSGSEASSESSGDSSLPPPPGDYYSSIGSETGKELAAKLHDLITSTHTSYSTYGDCGAGGKQKVTDQYYEGDTKQSGYLYEFYSGVKWPNGWSPTAGSISGGYNREHVWCKSLSQGLWTKVDNGDMGGGADMHHIRPVEVRLNSTRSNHRYGLITNRDAYKKYAVLGDSESHLGGYDHENVFEPIDNKKGDVARILFYIYIHYNSYSYNGLFGDFGTTDGPGDSSYFLSGLFLTSIVEATNETEAIDMLKDWNASDPVDESETRRNEAVYTYQHNRNPFIDFPEFVSRIWG